MMMGLLVRLLGFSKLFLVVRNLKRKFSNICYTKFLEAKVYIFYSLTNLLGRQGYHNIWVGLLFPILHNFKFDVNDLNDSIIDHVVIEI